MWKILTLMVKGAKSFAGTIMCGALREIVGEAELEKAIKGCSAVKSNYQILI